MVLGEFINENRNELDVRIELLLGQGKHRFRNDEVRWQWIQKNEGLRRWAKSKGVNV